MNNRCLIKKKIEKESFTTWYLLEENFDLSILLSCLLRMTTRCLRSVLHTHYFSVIQNDTVVPRNQEIRMNANIRPYPQNWTMWWSITRFSLRCLHRWTFMISWMHKIKNDKRVTNLPGVRILKIKRLKFNFLLCLSLRLWK